ncbi:MAG: glutamine-hydrolyzing GMP synthase [Anaerolineales bacterium]
MPDTIVVLDFGSQYSQLIVRRLRELQVYCELLPHDTAPADVRALHPSAYILSGGPASVYDADALQLPDYVLDDEVPVLGICYGMQLLAKTLAGVVTPSGRHEYGRAQVTRTNEHAAMLDSSLPAAFDVWMSHGDEVTATPAGFVVTAWSENCPIAAMEDPARRIFGLQFHPEVSHTEHGREILSAFVRAAGIKREWTPGRIVERAVTQIRNTVGERNVVAAVSGGVDSSVATALVQRAIGEQLTCFYVDTGLMRSGESEQIVATFERAVGAQLEVIEAADDFLTALSGVTDPEMKRQIIGDRFIRTFEDAARRLGNNARFLVQGTIYPDVVESSGAGRSQAAKIKTHHNVGGLPESMDFELIEPLRYLFKDEVRAVGLELGLPDEIVWRQPFPGPGLAIRCLGEVTPARLETLRAADKIFRDELHARGKLRAATAQTFAVLLPVKSVGVMGDARTYEEVVALRAVTTDDFMTADWARLPADLLATVSNRIINEVRGVNRVVYDISSKPPGTIEWE